MKDRLRKRLPDCTAEQIDTLAHVIEQYNLDLTLKNLDSEGLVLFDTKDRTVRIVFGEWRNKSLHVPHPKADIIIAVVGGVLGGWIESDKLVDAEDRMIVDIASLYPMPEEFCFDTYCSHLSDHGGIYEGETWICLNCGRKLIFNDKK
jgi:hypothetical protein